ncbi:C39 family peptidase [Paenibacillus caui]|uniref:C39 family peptidase n=1 Tax=Paenibacillus caui TaxID=2873927 RepID=UPI001CA9FCBC|nr:C39 family peptidase [Paenibacillus caui]
MGLTGKIKKSLFGLSIASMIFASSAFGYVGYKTLSIPTQKQEETNWCWAASGVMTIDYYGDAPTQSQFVDWVKGDVVNETATLFEVRQGIAHWGVSSADYYEVVPFGTLSGFINDNEPVVARIGWSSGGGHMHVIRGYYEDTSIGKQDVYYIDSLTDEPTYNIMSYSSFVSNSQFTWTHSLEYIRKAI